MQEYANIKDVLNYICNEIDTIKIQNKEILNKISNLPLNIESLEYKVNELKIDTLSGSLNLGLTASGDDVCVQKIVDKFTEDCSVKVN